MKKAKMLLSYLAFCLFLTLLIFPVSANEDNANKQNDKIKEALEVYEPDEQIEQYGTDEQLVKVNRATMEFVKEIGKYASESAQKYNIYASITIAQAIIESGSGKSGLSSDPYYNYFGMKGSYNGNSVNLGTKEDNGDGTHSSITASFKVYPSILASLEDHDELLRNGLDGYYSGTWKENTDSYHDAAYYLQGRYASDTQYADKLIYTIETYNLTRFDETLNEQDIAWLESDSIDPFEIPKIERPKILIKTVPTADAVKTLETMSELTKGEQ